MAIWSPLGVDLAAIWVDVGCDLGADLGLTVDLLLVSFLYLSASVSLPLSFFRCLKVSRGSFSRSQGNVWGKRREGSQGLKGQLWGNGGKGLEVSRGRFGKTEVKVSRSQGAVL